MLTTTLCAALTAGGLAISVVTALISVRKVIHLEPGAVFKA